MQWEGRNISAGYGKKEILQQVSLTLEQGAFCTVLGLNGAGKSTLLRTMAGLQPVLSGEVLIDGRSLKELSLKELASLRSIVLSGRQDVIGGLLVDEILEMALSVNQNTKEKKEEITTLLKIAGFSDRRLHTLSDGEFQRVMIARSLLQNTPFVFMDEPTAHLDVVARIELMQLLQRLPEQLGIGLVLTTHEVELAVKAGDQFVIIDDERAVHTGNRSWLQENQMISKTFGGEHVRYDENGGRFYSV